MSGQKEEPRNYFEEIGMVMVGWWLFGCGSHSVRKKRNLEDLARQLAEANRRYKKRKKVRKSVVVITAFVMIARLLG